MGRYTIMNDPAADAAVQEVLDRVTTELQGLLGDRLRAVVLAGGYGRGEGGIYQENGAYLLVNDLDILVLIKNMPLWAQKKLSPGLQELAQQLLPNGKGLKEIDLELTHIWKHRFLIPNTVGFYEIASGHKVIYGDTSVSKLFCNLDPTRLPVYEGTNYFRNRGSGLLLPAVYFLTDGLSDSDKRKNFQIEMDKACQAMGDALLLWGGQYHYSYRERLNRFRQLDGKALGVPLNLLAKVTPYYERSVHHKLFPDFTWPGDDAMIQKWFAVQEIFGELFLWYESSRLGQEFGNWKEYAQHINQYGASEPLNLKLRSTLWQIRYAFSVTGRNEKKTTSPISRFRQGLVVMPLLLFSLTPNLQLKPDWTAMAKMSLGKSVSKVGLELWKDLVRDYLITFYPKPLIDSTLAPWSNGV